MMDKFDLSSQPAWVVALLFFGTGVIVPIALAVIGRRRAFSSEYNKNQIEGESHWMVHNLLEIKTTVEGIERTTATLTATLNLMAIQIAELSARRR